jgi:hypothetical protein
VIKRRHNDRLFEHSGNHLGNADPATFVEDGVQIPTNLIAQFVADGTQAEERDSALVSHGGQRCAFQVNDGGNSTEVLGERGLGLWRIKGDDPDRMDAVYLTEDAQAGGRTGSEL